MFCAPELKILVVKSQQERNLTLPYSPNKNYDTGNHSNASLCDRGYFMYF